MNIYFDNASTTKPSARLLSYMNEMASFVYGNPSSMHDMGLQAEIQIKSVAKTIAEILRAEEKEIYFTSGGTESNNMAILGAVGVTRRKRLITTKTEHPSVSECCAELERQGFDVVYLSVDATGRIDPGELERSVDESTFLVSILHVNNETGVMQDLNEIGNIIKRKNKNTLFHVDAVQSFCKHDINVKKSNIDLLSLSAHKINGLKGTGVLYVKNGVRLKPLFFGGGQQKKVRQGTENTYGIFALGYVAQGHFAEIEKACESVTLINKRIRQELANREGIVINSPLDASPYILNISFLGIKAEVTLHALEQEHIYVSAGAACSSRAKKHTILTTYGLPATISGSSIRLSFGNENTVKEADLFLSVIDRTLSVLRRT